MSYHSYIEELKQYQHDMDQKLRSPDGWLTLVGLHWLKEGENTIGSNQLSGVPLPPYTAPLDVGIFNLKDSNVCFKISQGIEARVNGEPLNAEIVLESDAEQNPTIITLGDLSLFVIKRGERVGIRVKQVNSPTRLNFTGRIWWPIDEKFKGSCENFHL